MRIGQGAMEPGRFQTRRMSLRRPVAMLVGLLLVSALPRPAVHAQTGSRVAAPLTLHDAVDRALVRNDRVIAAREEVQRATFNARLARSAFGPKVVPSLFS